MTNATQLEDGFYLVRWGDEWVIRERQCGDWYWPYSRNEWQPEDIDEIDPRPIKREE